uniref:Uncharacterized protein n=1 Tax=Leersia perrieri TaxID=77586 RepID=A0A0D9VFE6_9ORYZ
MADNGFESSNAPAIHAVPIKVVAPSAPPMAMMQENPLASAPPMAAAGVVGNAQVDNRVMQQPKWLEKMVYVCIILTIYAIFKK